MNAVHWIVRGLAAVAVIVLVPLWFWLAAMPIIKFLFFNDTPSSDIVLWLCAVGIGFVAYVYRDAVGPKRFVDWLERKH